jgi:hypothetical protein
MGPHCPPGPEVGMGPHCPPGPEVGMGPHCPFDGPSDRSIQDKVAR